MCGIIGMKLLNQDHAKEAMAFVEQLLLQSEIRGRHATGFATPFKTNTIHVTKDCTPASEFVKSNVWRVLQTFPPNALIAHTRYSTSGDWHENHNNQPISGGRLAIAHNGLVSMATREEYEPVYDVCCETDNDSEIILQEVLNAVTHHEGSGITDEGVGVIIASIGDALEKIHSVDPPIFACTFLDCEGNVYAVRDHIRPLWFVTIKAWGFFGCASTRDIILRAIKATNLTEDDGVAIWEADPYTIYTLEPGLRKRAVKLPFEYPKESRFQRPDLVYRHWLKNRVHNPDRRRIQLDGPQTRDYRKSLRTAFKHYSVAAIASWEIDPNYVLLNYIFRRYEFSKSQEYWACWLYGVFYHPATLFWFMQEFPEFEKVDLQRLEDWHARNWQRLRYNTDMKYNKGHLVEMFKSYRDVIGSQHPDAQEQFFERLLVSKDPVQNFHQVWGAVSQFHKFGRYTVYIYTEALHRCMGMPIMADTMFLKDAKSSRNGLCYAIGRPDLVDTAMTKTIIHELEQELDSLLQEFKQEYPGVPMDMWFLESCLCAFKGLFRTTKGRYVGYYFDRAAEEILQLQHGAEDITQGVDWKVMWQQRKECYPWEYLGEYARPPRLCIQKSLEHVFRDTGHMVGLYPMIKRGLIPEAHVYSGKKR